MDLHSVIPKSCLVSVVFVVEGDGDVGRCFAISVVGLSASGFETTEKIGDVLFPKIICQWLQVNFLLNAVYVVSRLLLTKAI